MNIKTDKAKVYRLSLMENSTHKHIKSVKFTKFIFSVSAITAVVLLILLIYCIIAFTPLRYAIPGYPDARSKKTAIQNAIKIDSLESAVTRWNLYATNLSRVLSGEVTINFDSLMSEGGAVRYLSEKNEEALARQDSILRENVLNSELFNLSSSSSKSLPVEGLHFFQPLKGVVKEPFDPNFHTGIDISTSEGSVVRAVLDGTVIRSAWEELSGYVIIIQHKDDVLSIYSNNQQALVSTGDQIKAGSSIAIDKDHLHFELWHNGVALNPTKYINF